MNPLNIFYYLSIFLAGLCLGSFLNVIIYRVPLKLSVVTPPSSCPHCEKRLKTLDLVPLFSYLLLRGQCRYCQAKINARYPAVELYTGLLFVFTFYYFGLNLKALFYSGFLYLLTAICFIDLKHRLIPNSLVAAGVIYAVVLELPALLNLIFPVHPLLLTGLEPLDALLGFLTGGGLLLAVYFLSRGGMGAGDVKLVAMIGLFTGLRGVAIVLFLSFLFGALTGLTLMALKKLTRKDALPFAPFLALAAAIEIFLGSQIWLWYINLFA